TVPTRLWTKSVRQMHMGVLRRQAPLESVDPPPLSVTLTPVPARARRIIVVELKEDRERISGTPESLLGDGSPVLICVRYSGSARPHRPSRHVLKKLRLVFRPCSRLVVRIL